MSARLKGMSSGERILTEIRGLRERRRRGNEPVMQVSGDTIGFLLDVLDEVPAMFDSVARDVDKLAETFREVGAEFRKKGSAK